MKNTERSPFLPPIGRTLAVLGAVAAAAMMADGRLGRKIWPSTPLELVCSQPDATQSLITFSGLGSMAGREQSKDIAPLFPHLASAHWNYSSDGFVMTDLVRGLRARLPQLQCAGLNGHSMGGPVGLEVYRRAGIRGLGPIVLHSSPFDIKDVWHHKAARLTKLAQMPLGPGTKAAFSFTRGMIEGNKLRQSLHQARFDAVNGSSMPLWIGQMNTLPELKLAHYSRNYADMVGPQTEVWYCMPEDPARDTTINTVQASQRWGEFFADLHVPYHQVTVPESGHADVPRGSAALAVNAALLAHTELAA